MKQKAPIGVFDSGYGGLTVLRELRKALPQYDFLYLGDNARTPYGSRSFNVVYEYTLQAVEYLFLHGCPLVILACNTASAKALRTIQQNDLPRMAPQRRVLGVIRPCVEKVADITHNGRVGVLATQGTVASMSYPVELNKWANHKVTNTVQQACPMWVPLVENNEIDTLGADFFIKKDIEQLFAKDAQIDTVILGCTHYPLMMHKIRKFTPPHVQIIDQGPVVAEKLIDYLARHPEIDNRLSHNGSVKYLTTETAEIFTSKTTFFLNEKIDVESIQLGEIKF